MIQIVDTNGFPKESWLFTDHRDLLETPIFEKHGISVVFLFSLPKVLKLDEKTTRQVGLCITFARFAHVWRRTGFVGFCGETCQSFEGTPFWFEESVHLCRLYVVVGIGITLCCLQIGVPYSKSMQRPNCSVRRV